MHNYYNGAHSEIPTSRKPLNYTSRVVPIGPDINIAPSSFGSYYNQAYAPEAQGYRTSRESSTYHDVPMTNGINSLRASNLYQASDTVPLSSPTPLNNPTLANPYPTSASYADGSAYNRFSTQQMEGPSLNTNDNDPESQFFEGSFRPNVSTTATRRAASYRRKNEAKYVCRHCGTRFTTMRNQQRKELLPSPVASLLIITRLDHEDSHVNAKKYVCSECHLAMATRSNVLRHGRTQHPGLGPCPRFPSCHIMLILSHQAVYVESRP
ncbi:hypothetical protein H0H93_005514 [Arthromyces matolae]|nr:hypothetical protein H0H93_005514 [Arthromyces matolae]